MSLLNHQLLLVVVPLLSTMIEPNPLPKRLLSQLQTYTHSHKILLFIKKHLPLMPLRDRKLLLNTPKAYLNPQKSSYLRKSMRNYLQLNQLRHTQMSSSKMHEVAKNLQQVLLQWPPLFSQAQANLTQVHIKAWW